MANANGTGVSPAALTWEEEREWLRTKVERAHSLCAVASSISLERHDDDQLQDINNAAADQLNEALAVLQGGA